MPKEVDKKAKKENEFVTNSYLPLTYMVLSFMIMGLILALLKMFLLTVCVDHATRKPGNWFRERDFKEKTEDILKKED